MLIIVHALWGLALATHTRNIVLLLLGGIGGHILLDAIPHRDLTTTGQVLIDITTATTIFIVISRIYSLPPLFAWAVLFSTFPDIDVAFNYYGIWKRAQFPSHFPTWHGLLASPYGELINLIAGLVLLGVFLRGIKNLS